jgi:class 3 adenylate cyclase
MDEQFASVRQVGPNATNQDFRRRNLLASSQALRQSIGLTERHQLLERVAVTVLFTDIVDSTARVAALGDRRWHALLDRHHAIVRRSLAGFQGQEIDTMGDGFFAAFKCALLAIRCACAIVDAVCPLGIEVRAGLHTGECEIMDNKPGGLTVHIGARIVSLAEAGEVLVSNSVKDMIHSAGVSFLNRGSQSLKGVPGQWRLYAVRRDTLAVQ